MSYIEKEPLLQTAKALQNDDAFGAPRIVAAIEKAPTVNIKLTDKELLALKAVAHGCNTNHKCAMGTYVWDIKNYKEENSIDYEDAIRTVYSLIYRIETGDRAVDFFEEFEALLREKDMPITTMAVLATKKYADFKQKWIKL